MSADGDDADIGAVSFVTSPPSAHVYTVLMDAGVSVAVVVYPAVVRVVVYVITTVMGSVLALGVHTVPRSLEGMAHLREAMWIVGVLEG